MRKKRTLVLSCAIILLCTCIIVGGTYALLSESFNAHSHLVAGNLDIKLSRLNLIYPVLTDEGYLIFETIDDTKGEGATEDGKDFSGASGENVFGTGKEVLMVPGSYYQAAMKLANNGNVAFDYNVQVSLLDDNLSDADREFAKQLMVKIYKCEKDLVFDREKPDESKPLMDFVGAEKTDITGTMTTIGEAYFVVVVEFQNHPNEGDPGYDAAHDNNNAMKGEVKFDLVVTATQRTTPAGPTT